MIQNETKMQSLLNEIFKMFQHETYNTRCAMPDFWEIP